MARYLVAIAWLSWTPLLAAQPQQPISGKTGSPPLRARDAAELPPSPPAPNSPAPQFFSPDPSAPLPRENSSRAAARDPNVKPATFHDKVLALAPPGKNKSTSDKGIAVGGLFSVALSLLFVVGLFCLVMWMFRRGMPKGAGQLPGDVLEVVGRAPLAGRQQMHLIRLGNKLLLVAVSPGGMETLSEVTDPMEVDRLLGLCKQSEPNSVTNTFRNLLQQFTSDSAGDAPANGRRGKWNASQTLDEEVGDA